jgi:hypothetical protein
VSWLQAFTLILGLLQVKDVLFKQLFLSLIKATSIDGGKSSTISRLDLIFIGHITKNYKNYCRIILLSNIAITIENYEQANHRQRKDNEQPGLVSKNIRLKLTGFSFSQIIKIFAHARKIIVWGFFLFAAIFQSVLNAWYWRQLSTSIPLKGLF